MLPPNIEPTTFLAIDIPNDNNNNNNNDNNNIDNDNNDNDNNDNDNNNNDNNNNDNNNNNNNNDNNHNNEFIPTPHAAPSAITPNKDWPVVFGGPTAVGPVGLGAPIAVVSSVTVFQ